MNRQLLTIALCILSCAGAASQDTERLYLSGHGCDDMVEWDFKCSGGRRAGEWTKIGVPSCWELQGFGTYQYGMRFYGKAAPEGIADEKGSYKTEFTLPASWEGRQIEIVFEAVFTDATVTINGRKAGRGLYQGGFTRHTIDVSDRVFFGKEKTNRLEVEVAKESADPQVNMAERRADYWNFGGIWRPVFIVGKPWCNISRVAIDAGMDGRFRADVYLSRALPGCTVSVDLLDEKGAKAAAGPDVATAGDRAAIDFTMSGPRLWTAETPNLYTALFTLKDASGNTLHRERQRFGFRTIEYRHSFTGENLTGRHTQGCSDDGVFINGRKVIFKGVNRHSFRPETGRTLSKEKNIEDVMLIKSMNMNAVRLSHYPADPEFLDACDSLGLYVECELPGWHQAYPTVLGSQIAEEMVTRDVNHPSIVFWSNGNEGGFNYEIEPVFAKCDPQQRVVLYPWANRNGFETKHYRSWGETAEYMRQKEIFMPTEFLHGLYDGGHGAGLADYWRLMMSNPRCAGGFLWDLQDQAVLRTDMTPAEGKGRDNARKPQTLRCYDPVGNFGSDGIVGPHGEREGSYYTIKEVWSPIQMDEGGTVMRNCYSFTNLKDCRFTYKWLRLPHYGDTAVAVAATGAMPPPDIAPGESAPVRLPEGEGDLLALTATDPQGREVFSWGMEQTAHSSGGKRVETAAAHFADDGDALTATAAGKSYRFSKKDGRLTGVDACGHSYTVCGPRFVAAKRSDRSDDGFYNHDDSEAFKKKTLYTEYADQGRFAGFETSDSTLTARYRHGSLDSVEWRFDSDGTLHLTACATFNGVVDIMGLCFDYPEEKVKAKQWVGKGPYRVWQNRREGPQTGFWQTEYNDPIPAESWLYPEFKGYFDRVRWMRLLTEEGAIGIEEAETQPGEDCCIGVFTPRDGRDHTLYELPPTGLALLSVIPAVRNKVNTTDLNGPSAQPHFATGKHTYRAKVVFE